MKIRSKIARSGKLGALALSLMFVMAAVAPANAQNWRNRGRNWNQDRDLSNGEKAAVIGGGAAAGAVIGGLLNGRSGALLGGLIGGGAGTGYVLIKGRDDNRNGYYGREHGYNYPYNYNNNYRNTGYRGVGFNNNRGRDNNCRDRRDFNGRQGNRTFARR